MSPKRESPAANGARQTSRHRQSANTASRKATQARRIGANTDDIATWGELREGLHIAGYTFERACSRLLRMLEGDAWKLAGRFKDVNAFMDSLRFANLRSAAEERKRISQLIKAKQPTVSNRQIARTLGVDEGTVRGDLAENSAGRRQTRNDVSDGDPSNAENSAPRQFSGERAAKTVERATRVANQQTNVAERVAKVALNAEQLGKFSVLLADPPWDDEFGASNRSIENHYPTMKFEDILALPVADIAHDQAMLFLWATPSMIEMALQTGRAWGFVYRTQLIWTKPSIGLGKYVRQRHEILLICRRGDHPAPAGEDLPESVIAAPRGEHSAKPDIFHQLIERMYPTARRVELFRRGAPREGWAAWGAEAAISEAAA
jgi:N6-adenosine-specific RNA methylase IME4